MLKEIEIRVNHYNNGWFLRSLDYQACYWYNNHTEAIYGYGRSIPKAIKDLRKNIAANITIKVTEYND